MNKYSDFKLREIYSSSNRLQSLTPHSVLPNYPDSPFSIKLSKSNEYFRISALSASENFRAQVLSDRLFQPPSITIPSSAAPDFSFPNFGSLIDKINVISSNSESSKVKVLKDRKVHTNELLQNKVFHYKLLCKNKKTPLSIYLKRNFGSLKCYFSKTIDKPDENNSEAIFSNDYFELIEKSAWFSKEFYYLTLKSVESCQYSIMITFGKAKALISNETCIAQKRYNIESSNNVELRDYLSKRVDEIIKKRKNKALNIQIKDFVTLNKVSIPLHREFNWKEKQQNVLKKKKQILKDKIQKTTVVLHKKTIRFEISEHQKEISKAKAKLANSQKSWIKVLVLFKSLDFLKKKIKSRKNFKLLKIKSVSAARLIQTHWREKLNYLNKDQISLLNCRNNLRFLHSNFFKFQNSRNKKKLSQFFRESYLNGKSKIAFDSFFRRLTTVQIQVKKLLKRNKNRFLEVVKVWNQVLSKVIIENSRVKNNPYTRISVNLRDPIIRKHIRECCKIHERKMRIYISAYSVGQKCRTSFRMNKSMLFPKLSYLPNEAETREMISEAVKEIIAMDN